MSTRVEVIKAAAKRLNDAGIEHADEDARLLMQHALGLDRTQFFLSQHEAMTPDQRVSFEAVLVRRERREPVSQILGSVGFWTLDLTVTADVLTPRADSETLVDTALKSVVNREAPLNILDIATGSGALALALLSELPKAEAVATDISAPALEIARLNAGQTGLDARIRFVETSWAEGIEGAFDLLVSNPPYIATDVIASLDPEVREFEPRLALDGGVDGLAPYPGLLETARRLLVPGGVAVFEIGYDQGEKVLDLARSAHAKADLFKDLAGQDRVVRVSFD